MDNYSLADIATASGGNGFGGSSSWVLIILFALIFGFGGSGYGNSATSNEILFGQQFQNLDNKIDRIGNGIADATFALNNSVLGVQNTLGGAIADLKYDNAMQNSATQAMVHAEGEQTRSLIQQNKIDALQTKVAELTNQLNLQNAMCGIPKINPYMYGISPTCNCNCGNI